MELWLFPSCIKIALFPVKKPEYIYHSTPPFPVGWTTLQIAGKYHHKDSDWLNPKHHDFIVVVTSLNQRFIDKMKRQDMDNCFFNFKLVIFDSWFVCCYHSANEKSLVCHSLAEWLQYTHELPIITNLELKKSSLPYIDVLSYHDFMFC